MATGYRDLSGLVMLTGWDATELQKFTLKEGTTYAAIIGALGLGLALLRRRKA